MRKRSNKLTPPIADFLNQLEENQKSFADGIFPSDGWITAADDGQGYVVRSWDIFGPTVVLCLTSADVVMRLSKARDAALTRQHVSRQISYEFYHKFYEAVDAKPPRAVSEGEAKLCGIVRKISEAMVAYTANVHETAGRESTPNVVRKFRASSLDVDRLFKRANALYERVQAEATALDH